MDAALSEALTPVLRDLEQSGAPRPDVRDEDWADSPEQVTVMLYAPDGSGQGVSAIPAVWVCPRTRHLISGVSQPPA